MWHTYCYTIIQCKIELYVLYKLTRPAKTGGREQVPHRAAKVEQKREGDLFFDILLTVVLTERAREKNFLFMKNCGICMIIGRKSVRMKQKNILNKFLHFDS